MSLFIDVIGGLSDKIKASILEVIEKERKNQDRSIRKICNVCSKYLDYGELRYDKMENGIRQLQETGLTGSALYALLFAILHESLDEDQMAVRHFTEFSESSLAAPFRSELSDFIAIGKFVTLKEYDMLENAGSIIIERYTREEDVADTLSNLYLRAENEECIPVFQRLLIRANEIYPSSIPVESLKAFINFKGKDYGKALESFLKIKDRMEEDKDNAFYNHNLATTWDNIAECYLKLGNTTKTIESCDVALDFDKNAEEYKVGNPILYKKAEAFLLMGENEQALAIVTQILEENKEDNNALEMMKKITDG